MSLSKEFIEEFQRTKDCIKDLMIDYRYGSSFCQLCYPGRGKRGHSEWNCPRYKDPTSVRQRLKQYDLCMACGIPSQNHDKGCSPLRILIHNRGDRCRRCHTVGHIYWTCDGSGHHPGSQFKKTQPAKEIFDKGAQDFRNGENCKNDLQLFDDKIAKLEKTVEIMLNEQRESIMLEMKTMNKIVLFNILSINN